MKDLVPGDFPLAVKRSKTGLGLFAKAPIAKGAIITEYTGRTLTDAETYTCNSKYLFEVHSRKTIDGAARDNKARYINHSCKPNCEPVIRNGRVFIKALTPIKEHEELTYDYGEEYFIEHIRPRGCRCVKCG